MRSTRQISITLPNEMAAHVRARVASGEYASENEVIRDGLRALQARSPTQPSTAPHPRRTPLPDVRR